MSNTKIPYKIYLDENEMPKQWYNLRADMKNKPAPLLNPATMKPITLSELSEVFCEELARQELDETTPYIDIPEKILNFYKMYRPSPLVRAYCLEKELGTPAEIYDKFIKKHANMFMVFSGHVGADDIFRKETIGDHGNKISSFLIKIPVTRI